MYPGWDNMVVFPYYDHLNQYYNANPKKSNNQALLTVRLNVSYPKDKE